MKNTAVPFSNVDEIQGPLEMSYEDFKKEENIKSFEYFAFQCWLIHGTGAGNELLFIVQDLLKKYPQISVDATEAFARYQKVISLLMAASLVIRSHEDLREFFGRRLLDTLSFADVDVRENIYWRLRLNRFSLPPKEERENFALYMQNNTEMIGNQNLIFSVTQEAVLFTIGNWLKDYEQFYPLFAIHDSLGRIKYMNESQNALKLNKTERGVLLKVFEIYDFIKFPTVSIKEMGRNSWLENSDNRVRKIPPASPATLSASDLLALADKKINNAMVALRSKSGNNLETVVRAFYDNLFPLPGASYDRSIVIGALGVLAQEGWLLRALEEHNPICDAFVQYLGEGGKTVDIESFKLSPTSPLSLGRFLRFVLVRRMRMDESQAAAIAARIGNILKQAGKPEYFGMGYWDEGDGKFKWKM